MFQRGKAEAERDEAVARAANVTSILEANKTEIANLKAEVAKLKEQTTRLEARNPQSFSGSGEAVANQTGQQQPSEGQEAQAKIDSLEKKLANKEKELEYTRGVYQSGAQSAVEMQAENAELQARVSELEKKASETLVQVHRTQATSRTREFQRMLEERVNIVREREREIERLREELRAAKNGRRETRQTSVPRSPRLGMMSPRTVGRGGGVVGGPASRGTSPAPHTAFEAVVAGGQAGVVGMQFFNPQQGNGRWGHLRD